MKRKKNILNYNGSAIYPYTVANSQLKMADFQKIMRIFSGNMLLIGVINY